MLESKRQRAIVDFAWWAECNLHVIEANVRHLQGADTRGLTNAVLRFVVPRALNHSLEHSVLRIVEAKLLIDAELQHLGRSALALGEDYAALKRIRDKLVAHRVENEVYAEDHQLWYQSEFESFGKAFGLLVKVAWELVAVVRTLQAEGVLKPTPRPLKEVPEFRSEDVGELIAVLREAGKF